MIDDWPGLFAKIRARLRRHGRSSHEAEDLVQDAYVKFTLYEKEKVVEKPEAFLMTTAINLSKDRYRAEARRGEEALVEDEVIMDTAPSIEDVTLSRERVARLEACLARLPQKTYDIFVAHRIEGLRYQDIARIHRLSISSVEKHIAKALLMVSNDMEGWWP
jgi:RNA polymerase sigma-70 factor (ECF subfamily)